MPRARGRRRCSRRRCRTCATRLRQLRKSPGFAAPWCSRSALGIGANTAIFTPDRRRDAAHRCRCAIRSSSSSSLHAAGRQLHRYGVDLPRVPHAARRATPAFDGLAAYSTARAQRQHRRQPEPTAAASSSRATTSRCSASPRRRPDASAPKTTACPNAHPVAMLSHGYWKRRFGQDPRSIGRTISLSGAAVHDHRRHAAGVLRRRGRRVARHLRAADDAADGDAGRRRTGSAESDPRPRTGSRWSAGCARSTARRRRRPRLDGLDVIRTADGASRAARRQAAAHPRDASVLHAAATGLSELRSQFSQPLFILMAVVGAGAADRLRQRRQPGAGARGGARGRSSRAARARRRARCGWCGSC